MSGLYIVIGIALAGWSIGVGIENLGEHVKDGLQAIADALREIDEE